MEQSMNRLESSDSTVGTSNKSDPCPARCSLSVEEDASTKNGSIPSISVKIHRMLSSFWRTYKLLVRKYHHKLELVDSAIHRLLFILPHRDNSGNGQPWREVIYGLLSVNQLVMHCSQQTDMENCYGFGLCTRQEPEIPATSWRLALSALHCFMPSILELANSSGSNVTERNKRQAQLRLRMEQIKFVVRLYLLYSYWNQSKNESSTLHEGSCGDFGIMMGGGLYHPMADTPGMSVDEFQSVQRRRAYKGKRTGLQISQTNKDSSAPSKSPMTSLKQILLAELLYILRPVCWAAAEARHVTSLSFSRMAAPDSLFRSWIVTLGMDLLSLGLLSGAKRNGNPFTKEEWNRRRMKLFLYLLRAPIWNRTTSPALEGISDVALRLPILGRLVDSYLWDWILYWKHPYVSEEG